MNKNTAELLEKHFDTAFAAPNGIKKLRELILTLAMQGKLVPQDPSDQPASKLLQEIEAEKQRLVKAGEIKKPKSLPPMTEEEQPYSLPQWWEWVRLGAIASYIQRGKGPSYVDFSTHRVISQKCVRWYGLDLEPARYIDPESLDGRRQSASPAQPCTVVMEACAGAHYMARKLVALGHEVKLVSPQFVRPFVKSNKNDFVDAEAICEAASRPSMRFVTPKTESQQTLSALHRVLDSAILVPKHCDGTGCS